MPRFELTRYPTDNIISRLYILGFRPPELLSEKPIEVSSNSPDDIILLICSLNVACFTSNNSPICFCVSQTVSNSGLSSTSIFISPSVNKTISFFKKITLLMNRARDNLALRIRSVNLNFLNSSSLFFPFPIN